MRYTITVLAACASSAAALGSAVVANNCTSTIYAWSVGSAVGAKQTIAAGTLHTPCYPLHEQEREDSQMLPGKNFTELLHTDAKSGGIAMKITTVNDGLYNGSPQQIFSYSLDGGSVWYVILVERMITRLTGLGTT
jgi:hypothetical protein